MRRSVCAVANESNPSLSDMFSESKKVIKSEIRKSDLVGVVSLCLELLNPCMIDREWLGKLWVKYTKYTNSVEWTRSIQYLLDN